jgi:hypothetical protein
MITPTDLFSLLFATAEELSFFSPSPHEQMRGGLAFSLSSSLSPFFVRLFTSNKISA